jgi:hypothetical protein
MTTNKIVPWDLRSYANIRAHYPMRHPETGECGEWQGVHLADGETTERGYETSEVWVPMCCVHVCYMPCQQCMAASLGTDEGDEA